MTIKWNLAGLVFLAAQARELVTVPITIKTDLEQKAEAPTDLCRPRAPQGVLDSSSPERPPGGQTPNGFSAARLPKPTQPRTKTTLSEHHKQWENTPVDKARPFSSPRAVSHPGTGTNNTQSPL